MSAPTETGSVQAAVRAAVARFGSRPAVGLPGALQSFDETYDRAMRLGSALGLLGAGPGTIVALLASNGPWFFELYFAACDTGATVAPVNARFTLAEQSRYLNAIGPRVLLVSADRASLAHELAGAVPTIEVIVGIGEGHGLALDYDALLRSVVPEERPLRPTDEPVLVCATSGTTGVAKAVVHTQASTAAGYGPLIEAFEMTPDSHMVTGLAMYFAAGYSGWTMSFISGAAHTLLPTFEPSGWVAQVESAQATHGFLGPTPMNMIIDAGIDLARLRSLRALSLGGAACAPSRMKVLTAALGRRVFVQFGMTELAAATVLPGRDIVDETGRLLPTHRSIGRPIAGLDVRLVDADGEVGELELRGEVVSPGYLEEGRLSPTRPDGWFATGDLATIDDRGFISIVDRKKDLIVTGGINVAPLEIEQTLIEHPGILDAGVCGIPDDLYGESVLAAVVRADGAALSADEVVAWCRSRLASVKKPRVVTFVDDLPYSSTGKLLRAELRDRYYRGDLA